jgi:hypothetical protein
MDDYCGKIPCECGRYQISPDLVTACFGVGCQNCGETYGEHAGEDCPQDMGCKFQAPKPDTYDPTPEPAPTPGKWDVWIDVITEALKVGASDDLILAMVRRRQFGMDKYNTPLQYDNGRDARKDAQDEALDLRAYVQMLPDADKAKSLVDQLLMELFE